MPTTTAANKKRKRGDFEDGGEQKTLSLLDRGASSVGPVIASFPCIKPSHKTPYKVYATGKAKAGEEQIFADRPIHVAGETDTVEFYSTSETDACRYFIGVHNKRTKQVTIRPAPLKILSRHVKSLKNAPAPLMSTPSNTQAGEERVAARNALGETFGTKKAQKAIRAAERNRVDVGAMAGVTGHLQERIEASTSALPSKEEAKASADSTRLIPPYNAAAAAPADVYPLASIIPDAEFSAIPIQRLLAASSYDARVAWLPFKRSEWVRQHLQLIFAAPKPNKRNLKIVLYVATMLAFRIAAPKLCNDRAALGVRLDGLPSIIVDGLLARFTETPRGTADVLVTTTTETLLLTHLFALCLHVDDFATDTSIIASDLSMSAQKVNQLFKSLGCKIERLSATELRRLGLPDSAAETKRAILRVPVTFPEVRRRRARN